MDFDTDIHISEASEGERTVLHHGVPWEMGRNEVVEIPSTRYAITDHIEENDCSSFWRVGEN